MTLYAPVEPPQERTEAPDPARLTWVRVHDRPVEFTLKDRSTEPSNPFKPMTLIVEVPLVPAGRTILDGLAITVKSSTVRATFAE